MYVPKAKTTYGRIRKRAGLAIHKISKSIKILVIKLPSDTSSCNVIGGSEHQLCGLLAKTA